MLPVLHWSTVVTVGAGAVTVTVIVGAICVALVPPRLLGMAAARMLNAETSNKKSAGLRASIVNESTVSWSRSCGNEAFL